MNLSDENLEKVRVWLHELASDYRNKAENAKNKAVQEFYMREASKIKAFLEQKRQ